MKGFYWILFLIFAASLSFAQTSTPLCNPGDLDGKPGCPSGDCSDNSKPSFSIPVLRASDPNEIIGRAGYDSLLRWVSVKQNLEYKVLFENNPNFATAPAQNVTIYVPIHEKLNPSSLRISDFGFGSFNFSVPPNTSVYTNRLDVHDSLGVFVDVTAGLDVANRRAFWIFQSIDPATGLGATLPANIGFLPVNDSLKHNGEGYVTFSILPLSRSVTKDTTSARASIIFDIEETIATNLWKNTIDAGAPSSQVKQLPAQSGSATVTIAWEGQDDTGGSGIRDYDLYVSENNGPFSAYKTGLTGTTTTFMGKLGSSYRFYTLANDNVGNKEEPPASADAQITIGCVTPSVSISLSSGTLACASRTASLSAIGVGSARWSTGATTSTISVSVAGTYSVTLTSPGGCTATASAVVSASQAAPSVSISPSSATLTCASPTASLSVIGVGSARWSTGATTSSISASTAGTYSVTLTSPGGCTATASATVGTAFNSIISTVKNGSWDDPTTWSCGRVPVAGNSVVIQHVVSIPASYMSSALTIRYSIGGRLVFGVGSKIRLGF
ncbi:hypothetical protein GO755_20525 [Spirosoma sp. HMF4905]|uniref:DUF7619 domain-containing protein n=1 Tax=Spirosoma arboris TaxID=2682092 RepID=A0A7K1SF58_9BACT|nr:hypothetical protein [Spirosoma arboris]MVM32442.1 hypothetical protein [Spirosoma arboris]